MEKFEKNNFEKAFNFSKWIDQKKIELLLTLCEKWGIIGNSKILQKFIQDKDKYHYTKIIEKLISSDTFLTVDFVKKSEVPWGDTLIERFEEIDFEKLLDIDDYVDKIQWYDSIDIY